jgi:nucleotide-binding universal stress UspA family protein
MYDKILVSLSLSHGYGDRALKLAQTLKSEGGKIIVVHVFDLTRNSSLLHVADEEIEKVRKSVKEDLAKRIGEEQDVEAVMLTGHAGQSITEYARKNGVDCIIVGAHKPGLQDFFLGSTAARIMRYAECSVHVLR